MSPNAAFVTPALALGATTFRQASSTSQRSPSYIPSARPARVVCAAAATKESGKKKAPLVFSKDLKGNFVWTMRTAVEEDVDVLTGLFKNIFPRDLVQSFVCDSDACLICEVSIKGTKEGEGYSNRIMAGVLCDVHTMVKDVDKGFEGGLTKKAEFYCTAADPQLPDAQTIRTKLVLGALKKMKDAGVTEATIRVDPKNDADIDMWKTCLFKHTENINGRLHMRVNLSQENPDPQKKLV